MESQTACIDDNDGPDVEVSGSRVRADKREWGFPSTRKNNYPALKPFSSVDVNLPDGVGDDQYLASLDHILRSGFQRFHPDLMCYIAGADPYREDQLGGLALTIEGLKRRDELVFNTAKAHGIPVMVTLGGLRLQCARHRYDPLQHGCRGESRLQLSELKFSVRYISTRHMQQVWRSVDLVSKGWVRAKTQGTTDAHVPHAPRLNVSFTLRWQAQGIALRFPVVPGYRKTKKPTRIQ